MTAQQREKNRNREAMGSDEQDSSFWELGRKGLHRLGRRRAIVIGVDFLPRISFAQTCYNSRHGRERAKSDNRNASYEQC